jgi:allantoicase
MEIDLTPILAIIIDLLAAALMALGGWALAKMGRKFGLEADDQVRIYLGEALAGGIGWAKEQARKRGDDFAIIEVRSRLVAEAGQYVIERVPDAVERFGLNPARIERLIEARLGGV